MVHYADVLLSAHLAQGTAEGIVEPYPPSHCDIGSPKPNASACLRNTHLFAQDAKTVKVYTSADNLASLVGL